jgi:transposase
MDAYSEDLRKKIVEAVERRAMKKSEVARLFGVSRSSSNVTLGWSLSSST